RQNDRALSEADACVALRPNDPWGYTLRGHLRAQLRLFKPARADVERAIQLAPDLREPRLYRGVVSWLENRFDDALKDFDAVLQPPEERRLIEAAFYRGQLRLEQKQEAEALADFSLVIAKWPTGHPASLRRARISFGRGDVKKGLADLDAFLMRGGQLDPNSPQVAAERGRWMRVMLGELPRQVKKAHLELSLSLLQKAAVGGRGPAALHDELGT